VSGRSTTCLYLNTMLDARFRICRKLSSKIVRHRAVKSAALAKLRRADTIVVNRALSRNGLEDAAITRKMK
jgi:hypothetical protein